MDAASRWSPQSRGQGEYDRRAARSRKGGLIGGVWASGGRKKRGGRGGLEDINSPSPDSGVDIWWNTEMADQRGGLGGSSGVRRSGGKGYRQGAGVAVSFPKRHEFLRRSPPTPSGTMSAKSRSATHYGGGSSKTGRVPRTGGGGVARGTVTTAATAASIDGPWPRTQILGMNGGRLPREVRQAPIDRPLTAPCGKVGRRRVRTRGAARGIAG